LAPERKSDLDSKGRRLTLAPTGLAQYLSMDSCDRYLRFYLYKGETEALAKRLSQSGLRLALQPISPLMSELGDRIESQVVNSLSVYGYRVLDLTNQDCRATLDAIQNAPAGITYLYQAHLSETLNGWLFEGNADLIRVKRGANSAIDLLVGDVKSTRKDKVNHRLQVAVYVMLLKQMAEQAGLSVVEYAGTVVRRNPDGALNDPETAQCFDLTPYFAAIDQLTAGEESALARVDQNSLDQLHYYLDQKCDGCLFNPICFVDSDERKDVALVPFLESSEKRVLVENGIRTVNDLAALKQIPDLKRDENAPPPERKLATTPGKEALVKKLSDSWMIGAKLDRMVQRSARVLRRLDPEHAPRSLSYFLDSGRSILPDEKQFPDLIKVFLDAQTDYLEDRIYLAGALVKGPKGQETIVQMTPGVPNEQSERELLINWIGGIFKAAVSLADDATNAPIHLYLYNRHDQKALLEALRRHLEVFASIPTLYNLLTDSPALKQSAVSFVYDEVKERQNLPSTGHTLQAVASQLGFKWDDGEKAQYYRLFEQGMFDYLWRRENKRTIESSARFYSSIPLEYAYSAWGVLKAENFKTSQQRGRISRFSHANTQVIRAFQAKRLEALAYIENNFKFKNAYIKKEPLDLPQLGAYIAVPPPFRKVLEEFLFIEHYAGLQESLELFSQPILKRAQQGRALLARCVNIYDEEYHGKPSVIAQFKVDFSGLPLDPVLLMQFNKIKQGGFVALNTLEKDAQPWELVRGRLCIVNSLEGDTLFLKLLDMSFPKNGKQDPPFRYPHATKLLPEPGEYYTVDEMVDDLNGDKLLEACRNAEQNPFYHLIAQTCTAERNLRATIMQEKAQEFAGYVAELEGKHAPTANQREVIAGHLQDKLFLVQGPPGTGKSHTLGWAALARIYAALATGGTMRIAVSCQTHNAVKIVLESIADKLEKLRRKYGWAWTENLKLYKTGDPDESIAVAGVQVLDPWENRKELFGIFNAPALVVGGTPGGLYKLLKQKTGGKNGAAMWTDKPFDLVILDEASQMNLPQALLATAWLHPEGQAIVVGDHRQMSPILLHSWEDEERMSAIASQPYRSVFQYLIDQKFPRVALEESFRLHRVHAEFLHEHIYRQDGIQFHSRREQLLPDFADDVKLEPYLRAVMNPAYPVIVIVHEEKASQQANPLEVELITPIVDYCLNYLELDGSDGIGVVVPHRAQKSLLRDHFPDLAACNAIDTVERFQGGEREVIIVSATASDPDYVRAEADFLLNPNRLNVALSRPRKKLVVVASSAVFKFLSSDLDVFNQAVLWKRLLLQCAGNELWQGDFTGINVRVCGKPAQ